MDNHDLICQTLSLTVKDIIDWNISRVLMSEIRLNAWKSKVSPQFFMLNSIQIKKNMECRTSETKEICEGGGFLTVSQYKKIN